jgi:excisionase family DNA binding protein
MSERYMTAQEVADLLRVHIVTVRGWLQTGELKGFRLSCKTGWRIAPADVQVFIRRRTARVAQEAA